MNAVWIIAALAGCLALALVSTLRQALRDFSLRKLEAIAKGNGGMSKLEPIVEHDDAYALSMGAARSVCVAFVFIAWFMAFAASSDGAFVLGTSDVVLAGVLGLLSVLVFGTALASSVSDHAGERLIHSMAWFIHLVHALAFVTRPLLLIDVVVKRLAGVHRVTEKEEIEDDLIAAAMEGEREGTINESEREMIENVVELSGTTTEEIMTPRTDIDGLEMTDDLDEIARFVEGVGHSRIPVYTDDLDHIEGILYVKDLLPMVGRDPEGFELKGLLREAQFVHERKAVHELLVELQAKKVHMAIVLDEYGGTTGLVTLEDVMEEIVGEIQDEYETEEDAPPVIEVDAPGACARIDARATVKDANDALEAIGVEVPESDDYETVGGYTLALLGHFPAVGETCPSVDGGHELEVLEAEPTRIRLVRVSARRVDEDEAEAGLEAGSEIAEEPAGS